MQEIRVSLIIPVYNVGPYLDKCLQCAIKQSLQDIEIIIVDDGSTDASMDIIQTYAKLDNRIYVISQDNKGVSAARNAGLRIARGEYVVFADSDDFFHTDFLKILYALAVTTQTQIATCEFIKIYPGQPVPKERKRYRYGTFSAEEALKRVVTDILVNNYVWNKIFKRSLFTEHDIRFPEKRSYEDLAVMYKLVYYAGEVALTKRPLYYYLQRESSITRSFQTKHIRDITMALGEMKAFLQEKGVYHAVRGRYHQLVVKNMIFLFFKILGSKRSQKGKRFDLWILFTSFYRHSVNFL